MTIVDIDSNTTYKLLKELKIVFKKHNHLYKINNDIIIRHALNKIKEEKDYEIKLIN